MCEQQNEQAPLWLTDSYLEKVLQKYLKNDKLKIKNVNIKPATAKGDNYASIMSRIKVQYTSENIEKLQELSFIMKNSFESDPFISSIMISYDSYNTEMKMYEQVLPQLAKILLEVGDNDKIFAETLNVDYEKSAIIFEDLSVNNYILADRLVGLDEAHACMALKKLAKFHAAAAVLNQRLNGALEKFDHGIFNRYTTSFSCFYVYMIEVCASFAGKCPELGSYYQDKLMKLLPFALEYGARVFDNKPQHFNTLCHGDLWVNNMMMLYDSTASETKSLKDVLFIDFQISCWASPAVDLQYFLHTSLESKLHLDVHVIDKLVQYYHGILCEMLEKFNYSGYIPTLRELRVQLEEGSFLAVASALGAQPLMTNDQCDDADFHSLVDKDERARNFRNTLYKNKRVQNNIKTLLPYFDRMGLLDIQK